MEQTRQKPLLFEAAKLGQQVSGIIANTAPQLGESVLQHSMEILLHNFPQAETHYPGIFFDQTIKLVHDSPTTEEEKFQKYMDLSNQAKERMDYTRANQALLAALNAAQADLQQCKMLPSVHAALQRLHDWHTAYIEFHQHSGMAFFESAGISGYLPILSMYSKDNFRILQIVEGFQSKHVSFGIPLHQECMFKSAAAAAEKLALTDQSEQYSKQRYKWLRQCPFSDQEGRLTKPALSDPDHYLRQISRGTYDPIVAGVNALQLVLCWAKTELEKGLLTAGALRELFSFIQADWQRNDCDLLVRLTQDLDDEDDADESVESFADRVARCLYGVADKPTPSTAFLEAMQRLIDWLHLEDRPPSQAARLGTAKFIMLSRLHRQRLYMACQGSVSDNDISDCSEEQKMLEMIEALELAAGGGFVDQSRIQTSQRIQATLNKCYVPGAVSKRLISDEELRATISDCEGLALEYANSGRNFFQYQALLLQSRLQWQQYILFKTVPPDACLEVLEEAESLFNNTRKQLLTPSAADRISATINLTEDFRAQSHSQMGLMASFMSFLEEIFSPPAVRVQDQIDTGSNQLIPPTYDRFLGWTHRSKGRGLIDLIYFDVDIVQDLAATLSNERAKREMSKVESDLSSPVENLHIAEKTTLQKRSEQAKVSISKVTPEVLSKDFIDDRVVSQAVIDKMLSDVGDDVVLVDIINITYLGNDRLQAILYRKDVIGLLVPLPDMTLKAVETWVGDNLGIREKYVKKPLSLESCASEFEKLTPLLMPLFNPELPNRIKEEETMIFCLTGALHRVPVHAIPIHGKPLIESHPVAYCQNFTTLYRSYKAVSNFQPQITGIKSLAIMPSYKKTWREIDPQAEEELQQQVGGIFNNFSTTSYAGPTLSQEKVQNALSDCGHFFYYGHVHYDFKSPCRSALLLNQAAYQAPSLKKPDAEGLTVRDLFKVQLHRPALATLIGCGSGRALTSGLDDILGFPTALLFAGASAIVSTLWSIDADDGASFAVAFYDAIRQQQMDSEKEGMSGDCKSGLSRCVNLAHAMHEAIKVLRQRGEEKNAAYHWAAFYLTGFWLFPELAMKVDEHPSSGKAAS